MPFNAETARVAAIKSHEPCSRRFYAKPAKVIAEESEETCIEHAEESAEGFRDKVKVRVREHMTKLQDKIDDVLDRRELDVKAMRDLADSVLKLETVEARLSGRPSPGSLRPTSKPQRRQTYQDSEPEPVQVAPVPAQIEPAKIESAPVQNPDDWAI